MDKPFKTSIVLVQLVADSAIELTKKQLLLNRLNGKAYNYMNPQREGKKYVCWYYADVLRDRNIESFWSEMVGGEQ